MVDGVKSWYTDEIVDDSNIVIRMEDIVFNTKVTLQKLVTDLNIKCSDDRIDDFCKTISPSSTIGKGKILLTTESEDVIKNIRVFSKKFGYKI